MEWSPAAQALALMALPRLGHKKRTRRLQEHKDLAATFASFYAELERRPALEELLPGCEALVSRAQNAGLKVLPLDDDRYPEVLRKTGASPPLVLFVKGELPAQLLGSDLARVASVAVVGTRKATRGGLDEAVALGSALAAAGVVVVSGLALGVDAAAHRGALMALASCAEAAPTVAVLGGAHDRLHPQPHAGLVEKIVATGGAVISEYPPGVRPNRGSFLARNRIIAWLSRAVVVVEAAKRSGALSTAGYASDAGLPVLTVPASPWDRRRAGNLGLIQDGATPLIDLSDMAGALSGLEAQQSSLRSQVRPGFFGWSIAGTGGRSSLPSQRSTSGGPGANGHATVQTTAAEHDAATVALEQGIMAALHEHGEVSFDGLLSVLSRTASPPPPSAAQLAGALVRLELGGALRRGEDGRFSASGSLFASEAAGKT